MGQIMKLYMLEGERSRSLDAVQPLLGRGDIFYQANLWESISIVSIVCNRNCTQRPSPPANQRGFETIGQGQCDGLTGLCKCAIGFSGDDCSVAITTSALPSAAGMSIRDYILIAAAAFLAVPSFFAVVIVVCRKCSRHKVRVMPDAAIQPNDNSTRPTHVAQFWNKKKKTPAGMASINPATGKTWDVLDMAALQPVAPLGNASSGGRIGLGRSNHDIRSSATMSKTDTILHQFDQQRRRLTIGPNAGQNTKTLAREIGI
eukprot:SAG31_NODE_3763_length_3905_cov_1.693379_1_plen_260_part_00